MTGWLAAAGADVPPARLLAAAGEGSALHRDGDLVLATAAGSPAPGCFVDGLLDDGAGGRSIAAAWRALGTAALPRLRGAYTLLLWHEGGREPTLVTDHLGQGGAVWTRAYGGVLCAAEPATLLAALPSTPLPDADALAAWLSGGTPPMDRTLFAGIHRVPAAGAVALRSGRLERYWHPPRPGRRRAPDGAPEAAGAIRAALDRAVDRATAHGSATVLLSGGLDSSAVAAVAARRPAAVREAASAVFPDHPEADEAGLVATTTRALNLRAMRVEARSGGGILRAAAEVVERWALPPATPNAAFWLPLLRAVHAQGTRVLLDGQGGDEVFGLSPFLLADRVRRGDLLGAWRLVDRVPGAHGHAGASDKRAWVLGYGLKGAVPPWADRLVREVRRRADPHAGPPHLRPDARRALDRARQPEDFKRTSGPRWWAYLVDAVVNGPGPALAFDDLRRRDALCGLRSRHPLVDVDLVELVLTLPPELAFDSARSRPLLRAAVAHELPDEVRLRPQKSSFDAPFHEALAGADAPALRRLLGPGAHIGAFADLDIVARTLLKGAPRGAGDRMWWGLWLWRIATAELWLRRLAGEDLAGWVGPEARVRVTDAGGG